MELVSKIAMIIKTMQNECKNTESALYICYLIICYQFFPENAVYNKQA